MVLLLIACLGGGGGSTTESGEIVGSMLTANDSASVKITRAWGYHIGGVGGWYLASGEQATCEAVVDYLTDEQPHDPTPVFAPGGCNITLSAYDYDGGDLAFTEEGNFLDGYWSLNCAMGDGQFELDTRNGYTDYYWSGNLWTGTASSHVTGLKDQGEEGYQLDVSFSAYDGNYVDQMGDVPASGLVEGVLRAESCEALRDTALFVLN